MTNECINIEPKFHCELCPLRFKRNEHLRKHMTRHHHHHNTMLDRTSIHGYNEDFSYGQNISSCTSKSSSSASSVALVVPAPYLPTPANAYPTNNYHHSYHQSLSSSSAYATQNGSYQQHLSSDTNFDNQHFLHY